MNRKWVIFDPLFKEKWHTACRVFEAKQCFLWNGRTLLLAPKNNPKRAVFIETA